jgi:hypothetical protein
MRDLQEWTASVRKNVRPMKSYEQKCYGLWPLSCFSSFLAGLCFVFTITFQFTFRLACALEQGMPHLFSDNIACARTQICACTHATLRLQSFKVEEKKRDLWTFS